MKQGYPGRALLLLALTAAPAAAQESTAAPAGSPKACLQALRDFEYAHYRAAKASNTRFDLAAVRRESAQRARACAGQFDAGTIAVPELADLGALYLQAGQSELAARAFDRLTSDRALPDSARANGMAAAILAYFNVPDTSALERNIAMGESYLGRIDSIPGAVRQQLEARELLLGVYRNNDMDAKSEATARAILGLAARLPSADRGERRVAWAIISACRALASAYSNRLQRDSAVAVLQSARATFPQIETGAPPALLRELDEDILRVGLVGQPAPALHADYTLNGSAQPWAGHVTVVMFTAHWCHSCAPSYSVVRRLQALYGARGLRTVLTIDLDGSYDGAPMTPEQEVAANRTYYVVDHEFSETPILFQRPGRLRIRDLAPPDGPDNSVSYGVGWLPTYFVVDAHGVVRAVLDGWDAQRHREATLTSVLKRLLGGTA